LDREYFWDQVNARIRAAVGSAFTGRPSGQVAGGCINHAVCLQDRGQRFFVKVNEAVTPDFFEAEALGLAAIAATETLRVPEPVCTGSAAGCAFIVLEWLELGAAGRDGAARLGERLAALHAHPAGERFGWQHENWIGATPQVNRETEDWPKFFTRHRLGFQLRLAAQRGPVFRNGERLLEQVPRLLQGHQVRPALLHGDLWSGNAAFTSAGEPVVFDPAVYRGDREADLAMTELFGGFAREFYTAYERVLPRRDGYPVRATLYNLYHVLNHFNLFGGHYRHQAEHMIEVLLRS